MPPNPNCVRIALQYHDGASYHHLKSPQWPPLFDYRQYRILDRHPSREFLVEIDKLAENLAKAIQRGPPRNPSWEICRSDKFETNAAEILEHLKASDEESWGDSKW